MQLLQMFNCTMHTILCLRWQQRKFILIKNIIYIQERRHFLTHLILNLLVNLRINLHCFLLAYRIIHSKRIQRQCIKCFLIRFKRSNYQSSLFSICQISFIQCNFCAKRLSSSATKLYYRPWSIRTSFILYHNHIPFLIASSVLTMV